MRMIQKFYDSVSFFLVYNLDFDGMGKGRHWIGLGE